MKPLSTFTFAAMLSMIAPAISATAAIDCGTLPTCESLGYNDISVQCPKSSTGAEMVIKCPFDTSKGKCIHEAAIGEIAYFTKKPNADSGWLPCDGSSQSRTKYPELAAFLDTQFCNSIYHLNAACSSSSGTFAVPNYKGYFLRVAGTPNTAFSDVGNSNYLIPQAEGLPDISGSFPADDTGNWLIGGAFTDAGQQSSAGPSGSSGAGRKISFNASSSNDIYGKKYSGKTGVVPVNIAVYAYIYAGKVVQ